MTLEIRFRRWASVRKKLLDVYTLQAYREAMFTFIESSIIQGYDKAG